MLGNLLRSRRPKIQLNNVRDFMTMFMQEHTYFKRNDCAQPIFQARHTASAFGNVWEEAQDHFSQMRQEIETLRALGIKKDVQQQRSTSNIIVTYPAKQDLDFIGKQLPSFTNLCLRDSNTLYVHIPFCSSICSYCSFARTAAGCDDNRISEYLGLLEKEAAKWKSDFGARIPVDSIYIGGGTPTLLSPSLLERLFEIIDANFLLAKDGEYTLEASPYTTTIEKFALAKSYGVNRTSMGVESFNAHVLADMGRDADVKKIYSAIQSIKSAGIDHIDIDLIRGYPSQTVTDLENDLIGMQNADVPSITSYQYSVKNGSIDKKKFGEDFTIEQDRLILSHLAFIAGAERLGYRHQAPLIDWFVKGPEWAYQQQIQKWLKMTNLIGLGLGAYGYVNGVQYINTENRKHYAEAVSMGHSPIEKATRLSYEEIMRRKMIFGLKGYIDRQEFRYVYGIDVLDAPFGEELETLIDAGGIEVTDATVKLSKAGTLFADWIQMQFYSDKYKHKNEHYKVA